MPAFNSLKEAYKKAILPLPLDQQINRDTQVFVLRSGNRVVYYAYVGVSREPDFDYEIYQKVDSSGFPLDWFIDAAKDHDENSYALSDVTEQQPASDVFVYV